MNINNVQNINFTALRGLGEPRTAQTYKALANKYGTPFLRLTKQVFAEIDKTSDDKDVFIKFDTDFDENGEERTNAQILDENGNELTKVVLEKTDDNSTMWNVSLRFDCLLHNFKKRFFANMPLEEEVRKTINKFA